MSDLLERLRDAGIPLDETTVLAMEDIDPSDFTDYNLEPFWHDRPVPFLFTDFGATRTISAPHMIATLLHHLEVIEGQHVLLIGSKGGYLAAIIDRIVGCDGAVTIIEPHDEVRMHTEDRLGIHNAQGLIRVLQPRDLENHDEMDRKIDRVLITGSVRRIPESVEQLVLDGGFVLGPFGGPVHQRLLKKEKQGFDWFDTDLGGVVFGPMDVGESETSPLDPNSLANHIEDALDLVGGLVEIEENTLVRVIDMISTLREMPSDLPVLDEDSTEDEIMGHPVVDLLMSEIDWLGPLWPLFSDFLAIDLASPGSPEEEMGMFGGHEDLVP
tara:strand:- start:1286 stop:2266 length:981 start_codon:yes stop_codon:yes gene_type:complete